MLKVSSQIADPKSCMAATGKSSSSQFETLIRDCEVDLRLGRAPAIAKRLSRLKLPGVPRPWRLPLAGICRRAGLYATGFRLLSPLVLSEGEVGVKKVKSSGMEATPAEKAEYAVLLLRIGAVNEGLEKLAGIDPALVPEALLFRAYSHFALWEHEQAVPLLQEYLAQPLSPHARQVGHTNLALALVECRRRDSALSLLKDLLREAKTEYLFPLEGTAKTLMAQLHLQEGDFAGARRNLAEAKSALPAANPQDQFWMDKLSLIVSGLENRDENAFAQLRREAFARQDWHALREADFYSLKANFTQEKFLHLIFGTPFPALRERLRLESGWATTRSLYVLGPKDSPRFDLVTGTLDGEPTDVAGGKVHQTIEALLRDFYQPKRLAGLFSTIFPGEQFNIATSPARMRQLLKRTRQWFKRSEIPVQLVERKGFYYLLSEDKFSFRVPLERRSVDSLSVHFPDLIREFAQRPTFTAHEASAALKMPTSSVQRVINKAIAAGYVEKWGDCKKSTLYKIRKNRSRPSDPRDAAA